MAGRRGRPTRARGGPPGAALCYHRFVVRIGIQMRLILVTGKGGAGASTLAAATAAAPAGGGRRTPPLGAGPGPAAPAPSRGGLRALFAWRNMDETVADDIAALPGLVDLTRLLALDEQVEGGQFDAAVPAFPPPPGGPAGGEEVYGRGRELPLRLSRLRRTLSDPESASLRLVLTADKGSLAEAQRAITALSLFAYPADAAFCNRVLPDDAGPWSGARRADQREGLSYVADALAPLPVISVPLQPRDVAGLAGLAALGGPGHGGRGAAARRPPPRGG